MYIIIMYTSSADILYNRQMQLAWCLPYFNLVYLFNYLRFQDVNGYNKQTIMLSCNILADSFENRVTCELTVCYFAV